MMWSAERENVCCYKKLFLTVKQIDHVRHLIWSVEKAEVIPDNTAPKSYFLLFDDNYYKVPQYEHETVKAGKDSQQKGFVTRFLGSFPRNSAKSQPKDNFTEIHQN